MFLLVVALAALAPGDHRAHAQPDGVARLLHFLETTINQADAAAYARLLTPTADRRRADAFAAVEFPQGVTRAVVHERQREPLAGTLPGNGYRIVVDVFEEIDARARIASWAIDLKRTGEPGTDAEWQIDEAIRLSAVENLHRLSLDPARRFSAHDLRLAANDLELTLPQGSVFVATAGQGVTAVVLLGAGTMAFHPPSPIERGQVRIFSGADRMNTPFDAVYARLNPADFDALVSSGALVEDAPDAGEFRRADAVFREDSVKSFSLDLGDLTREVWSVLPNPSDFLAEIHTRRFDTLTYSRSSSEPEDISLFDRKRRRNISLYASPEKLAQQGVSFDEDQKIDIDVEHYDIDLSVAPDRPWLEGRARLTLRVRASSVNSLTLRLAPTLIVQSIVSDEFGRLFGLRVRNDSSLVVNLPGTVPRDTELHLLVAYAGRLERQVPDREVATGQQAAEQMPDPFFAAEPSFLYSTGSAWYPQPGTSDYATATLRIDVPEAFGCVASGELERVVALPASGARPARRQFAFSATQPLRYLGFVLSRFAPAGTETLRLSTEPTLPAAARTSVWYRGLDVSVQANPRQVGRGRGIATRAADIAAFYASILNDIPYPSFTVALTENDLPGGHSPAYFAVLNQALPTSPLVWAHDPAAFSGYPDFFLAHELAHQWWGQAVGYRNYHEQWLSEGLAQYFAALYAQHQRGDETFGDMLRQMRRWAAANIDEGPIALGYRLGHIRGNPQVFRAVLYDKTAVVLHMLRRLIGDDAFFRGLRTFYADARFRKVGTNDFQAAMERESGRALDRFFEQWFRGASLPRVKFTYRVEGPTVVLRADQVGEVFDVPLTVTLRYAGGTVVDVPMNLAARSTELRLPLAGVLRTAEVSHEDVGLVEIAR